MVEEETITGDVIAKFEEVSALWLRAWELGREAQGRPGGPDIVEVDDCLQNGIEWHCMAARLREKYGKG